MHSTHRAEAVQILQKMPQTVLNSVFSHAIKGHKEFVTQKEGRYKSKYYPEHVTQWEHE